MRVAGPRSCRVAWVPLARPKSSLCTVFLLEIGVNYVLAAADGPLDYLHAAQAAGVVGLLAPLEVVELGVCAAAERVGAEMREVVPFSESLDVAVSQGFRCLGGVARVFVDFG